ncbi:ABC transporter substrate-binding protein [Pleomorphomonas carboxyditropha]|nr:ABC transporter substrate-binding protein [Pleomorphomonas carboxyditropha]
MTDVLKLSRRGFMAATSVLIAGSTLGAVSAQTARKTLRIAAGEADGPKGTLDPAFSAVDPDSARVSLVYERLVIQDDTFTPQPQLALSWESNETADVWTFKLRQDVKFQDGEPFTARHVVYTFRRLLDPATGSPGTPSLSAIDGDKVEAVDDYTVRFTLKTPVVEFPSYLVNRFTYIVKEGQPTDQLRTAGIGTGPFKVEHYVPGEEPAIFVKNDTYWRPGLPKVDAVELRSIPDPSARIAAIAAGQVHVVWDLPRIGLETLESNPDVHLIEVRAPFVMTLSFWTDTKPFDDVRVRQALKAVVDREAVLKLVAGGHGTVAADNPVAPWIQYGLDEPAPKRDVARAKQLLAEAGYPDGIDLELFTSGATPGFVELATLYQGLAAEAGIRVKVTRTPDSEYWSNIWLKKPFISSSWSGRDADAALSVPYLSDADWNETHWKNPEFDGLIHEARRTVDAAKRAELYQKAQKLLQEDGGVIIPVFVNSVAAASAGVSGVKLYPQGHQKDFSEVDIGA